MRGRQGNLNQAEKGWQHLSPEILASGLPGIREYLYYISILYIKAKARRSSSTNWDFDTIFSPVLPQK